MTSRRTVGRGSQVYIQTPAQAQAGGNALVRQEVQTNEDCNSCPVLMSFRRKRKQGKRVQSQGALLRRGAVAQRMPTRDRSGHWRRLDRTSQAPQSGRQQAKTPLAWAWLRPPLSISFLISHMDERDTPVPEVRTNCWEGQEPVHSYKALNKCRFSLN